MKKVSNFMKKIRLIAGILSILVLAGSLAGCGSSGEDEQVYNTYIVADPTSFDSGLATDTTALNMLINLMEPLLRLNEKEDGTVETLAAGAESYTVSDDGLVWTFQIRDNQWSDGVPVTAQDYAYGISRVLDPEVGAAYSYLFLSIKNAAAVNYGELPLEELGVKALDEKTLEITLEGPNSYFMDLLYHSAMLPVRQDIVEQYGDAYGTEADKMVFNGPFRAESWTHNSEIVLVKNDTYWDSDSVKLERITYKVIQDENAVYSSLENGSIDSASTTSKEWTDQFLANDRLVHVRADSASTYYQYYNQYDELFSNVNVRKAFTLAVDREDLNEVIYDGMKIPAYSMIPTGVYVDGQEYAALGDKPIEELAQESGDPRALLIQGLEELGMDPDPTKLTVTLSLGGTDQWTRTLAEYMQQTYKETLGVNLEIEMLDWGAFIDNYYNYDYQMAQMSFGAEWNDPLAMLSSAESSQDGFCIGWGDERVDELLAQATATADGQEKIRLIQEIEEIFLKEDACVCPLTFSTYDSFTYDYVKGVQYANFVTTGFKYTYIEGK